ncbi:MAG: hypothetical protein GX868_01010 [Actinobacteria bacterium]|nr:hypothetical protein [Actinomycetota bacterium]
MENLADPFHELDGTVANIEALLETVALAMPESPFPGERGIAADTETFREITSLVARLRHASVLLDMMLAGAADVARMHRREQVATSRGWVAHEHGLSSRDASELVRADAARRRHPELDRAVRAGEVTLAHVLAIGSIIPERLRWQEYEAAVDLVNGVMGTLLGHVEAMSIDEFRRLCAAARDRLDTDGPAPSRKDDPNAPSELRLSKLFNGRWSLTGDLSAGDGAVVATMLEHARAQELRDHGKPAGAETGGGETAGAAGAGGAAGDAAAGEAAADAAAGEAAGDAVAGGTGDAAAGEAGDTAAGEAEVLAMPLARWQAEVFMRLLADGAGAKRRGRAAFYLHIDLDDLLDRRDLDDQLLNGVGVQGWSESGYDVSDTTVWNWLSGADVTPIFEMGGQPLTFGRTRRIAPDILRRALAYRDRRCRAYGCDAAPVWTQAHHLKHWEDQGTTDPENMRCKCFRQHRAEHQAGVETANTTHRPPCFRQRIVEQRKRERAAVLVRLHDLLTDRAA